MDFSELTSYVDSLQEAGVPGCDLVVYRDHEQVFRHMAGWRDEKKTQPMRGDETYWIYSCTKVFTTCAAMQLIGEGKLSLDDPVSRYLPVYAELKVKTQEGVCPAKRVMTIRHLMSMQSGLSYELETPAIRQVLEETGGMATTRQLMEAKAKDPLEFEPGEDFLYSLSHDVLAAVIEAVSGLRFSEYLKKYIFEPLHLETVSFALTPEAEKRMCAAYRIEEDGTCRLCSPRENSYRLSRNYESGGAGLLCDVQDYITFADALACGGVTEEGVSILSPEMIQLWSANQLAARSRRSFDDWKRLGYSYALGVRTRIASDLGGKGQVGEFGWDGAAGAWTLIDPINHLSAYYGMHVRNFGYSYDVIHPKLRDLIYRAL